MPGKRIRTLLDSSAAYFARAGPTTITVTVDYEDQRGRRHRATIEHDLEIYRDLVYVAP
jgi:hypothetical protein